EVAYACVSRCSGNYVVTQSVDQVVFKRPVRIGESVTSLATVNFAGRTSLEVGVKVNSECSDISKRYVDTEFLVGRVIQGIAVSVHDESVAESYIIKRSGPGIKSVKRLSVANVINFTEY
ncbi:MAG: hypothetical protein HOC71_10965, partial [Candidatus Latescibacteria bacterium]|nr:hypothetical protein [Candidatus Latescibacterota bacterium]